MGIYDRDYMRRSKPPSISFGTVLAIVAVVAVLLGGTIYLSHRSKHSTSHRRAATRESASREPSGPLASSESTPLQPINVNTATEEQLASIPYIPSDVKRAIMDYRPYSTPDDLMRVPGIKKRRMEQIRPYVTVKWAATPTPNHAMERTPDGYALHFWDDFHTSTPSDARFRPPSLILFSLGGNHAMRFGDPAQFAVEAYYEPAGPEWGGFGRMCIYVESVALGDLSEEHCSLFHAVDRFREVSTLAEGLWDDSFAGLSDAQVFALLDDALFIGSEPQWDRYGKFDFLTNTGEQFDDFKTFIFCSADRQVHILWRLPDATCGSGVCASAAFRDAAGAFIAWFDGQVGPSRQPPNQSLEPTTGRSVESP